MHLTYRKILYVLSVILTMGAQLAAIYAALRLHTAFSAVGIRNFGRHTGADLLKGIALPCILFTVCLLILTERDSRINIKTVALCSVSSALPFVGMILYYITDGLTAGYVISAAVFALAPAALVNMVCDILSAEKGFHGTGGKVYIAAVLLLSLPAAVISFILTRGYPGAQMFALFYCALPLGMMTALTCRAAFSRGDRICGYICLLLDILYCAAGFVLPVNADAAVIISGYGFALCYAASAAAFIYEEIKQKGN